MRATGRGLRVETLLRRVCRGDAGRTFTHSVTIGMVGISVPIPVPMMG